MTKTLKEDIKTPKNQKEVLGYLKAKFESLDSEIKHDVTPAIVASFGFIIALVWRDAIKGALDHFLESVGLIEQAYLYNFISAIIVTIVVIGIMISVAKYGRRKRDKSINQEIARKIKNN